MTFPETLAWLRETFPVRRKVLVRLRSCRRIHGSTAFGETGLITVTINKDDDQSVQKHSLIHEWAHVLQHDNQCEPHGLVWEHFYGEIYRAWEKA